MCHGDAGHARDDVDEGVPDVEDGPVEVALCAEPEHQESGGDDERRDEEEKEARFRVEYAVGAPR